MIVANVITWITYHLYISVIAGNSLLKRVKELIIWINSVLKKLLKTNLRIFDMLLCDRVQRRVVVC